MVAPPELRRGGRGGGGASAGSLCIADRNRVQHCQCRGTQRADPRGERRIGLRLTDRRRQNTEPHFCATKANGPERLASRARLVRRNTVPATLLSRRTPPW